LKNIFLAGKPKTVVMLILAFSSMFYAFADEIVDEKELEQLFSTDTKAFASKIELIAGNVQLFNNEDKAVFSFYKGLYLLSKNDIDAAEIQLNRTVSITKRIELKFRAYSSLINVFSNSGNYSRAFKYAFLMNDLERGDIDSSVVARGLNIYITLLAEAGLYDESTRALQSLTIENLNDNKVKCGLVAVIAYVSYKSADPIYSWDELNQYNNSCLQSEQVLYGLLAESMVTRIQIDAGQIEVALKTLEANYDKAINFGYGNLTAVWLANLTDAWISKGNTQKALQFASLLANVNGIKNSLTAQLITYGALANSFKIRGDNAKYAEYMNKYHQTYVESHNKQIASAFGYYAALMQAAENKQQIELLNQKTFALQLENELAKAESTNNRLYLLVAVTLLLLLGTILFRTHRSGVKLKERVTFDKLTRVFSRDHFEDVLATCLTVAQGQQQKLGFVLFDLDHFKQVNDSYGHQTGDWVLQQAANAAQQCLRKSDAIGRIGGEEFAILLQDCDLDMSRALAESVRLAIADIDTTPTGHKFAVTASFGVSTAQDYGYSARKLFAVADEALYQAKQQGRNRVMPQQPQQV
jgi:diguanylate cyclase (GGDEF)-like protein